MIKILIGFAFILMALPLVLAHCPLCTTGAAVGVGIARTYGVDDSIVGLFLGALIVSSALWFNKWLTKKVNYKLPSFIMVLVSFLIFAIPFYYAGLIINFEMVKSMPSAYGMTGLGIFGLAQFGVDKLLFGMLLGTITIWLVFGIGDHITKKRGKRLFDYQGLSFMILALMVLTLGLWIITK